MDFTIEVCNDVRDKKKMSHGPCRFLFCPTSVYITHRPICRSTVISEYSNSCCHTCSLLRDKSELQMTIRSLKDTNATLQALNRELEEKLFRVKFL